MYWRCLLFGIFINVLLTATVIIIINLMVGIVAFVTYPNLGVVKFI